MTEIDREQVYQVTVCVEKFNHGTGEGSLSQRLLVREFFRRTDAQAYALELMKDIKSRDKKALEKEIVSPTPIQDLTEIFNPSAY